MRTKNLPVYGRKGDLIKRLAQITKEEEEKQSEISNKAKTENVSQQNVVRVTRSKNKKIQQQGPEKKNVENINEDLLSQMKPFRTLRIVHNRKDVQNYFSNCQKSALDKHQELENNLHATEEQQDQICIRVTRSKSKQHQRAVSTIPENISPVAKRQRNDNCVNFVSKKRKVDVQTIEISKLRLTAQKIPQRRQPAKKISLILCLRPSFR